MVATSGLLTTVRPSAQALDRRQAAEAHVGPGTGEHDDERGSDEAAPGHDQPPPSRPLVAQVNGHLGRVGARYEVRRTEKVDEPLAAQPAAATHRLVFHHGDVGRGPAETDDAQLQEESRHLAQRGGHDLEGAEACERVQARMMARQPRNMHQSVRASWRKLQMP